jgi:hypothetical protein
MRTLGVSKNLPISSLPSYLRPQIRLNLRYNHRYRLRLQGLKRKEKEPGRGAAYPTSFIGITNMNCDWLRLAAARSIAIPHRWNAVMRREPSHSLQCIYVIPPSIAEVDCGCNLAAEHDCPQTRRDPLITCCLGLEAELTPTLMTKREEKKERDAYCLPKLGCLATYVSYASFAKGV